ncbi:MAG: cytochrome B [Cyclobacteriaceae bacterium]
MYELLLNIHSILRWVLLFLLVVTIIKSLVGWLGNHPWRPVDNQLSVLTLIFTHTQLIIGLILYFISPIVKQGLSNMAEAMKIEQIRFYTVEHITGMLVAIILITVGRVLSKKRSIPKAKFRIVTIFFTLGLIIMILMIRRW